MAASAALSTESSVLGTEQDCPVGFDLSSDTWRVSFIPGSSIVYQIARNRHGQLGTPAAVRFDGRRRLTGKDAVGGDNCFSDVMKIIGRSMSDIQSVPELQHWVVKEQNSNVLLVAFPDSDARFTPAQVLAMLITDLKITAERALSVTVEGCCIGVPSYFTQSERTAVHQAAEIAGLSQISLINSTTAAAIYHGISRKLILKKDTYHHVVFVDVGKTVLQVSIVRLGNYGVEVLSYLNDSSTAEKNFLDAIASHFQKTKYNAGSTHGDPEKLKIEYKKGKAPINIYDDNEISESMFTKVCGHILNQLGELFKKALSQAKVEIRETGLVQKKIVDGVVLTGPGVQICALHSYLQGVFKQKPTGDAKFADESVAKGCAIQCAIKSAAFKKRTEALRHKILKDGLLKCKVNDDVILSVKEQMTEVPVLGADEISVARENERRMGLREKLKVMVSDMLKIAEFAREDEEQLLNDLKDRLDHDDLELDEKYNHVNSVQEIMLARKNEHEQKYSMAEALRRKLKHYDGLLLSEDRKYKTIKQKAREEFKGMVKEIRDWLVEQTKTLSTLSGKDDPISFIHNVNGKIKLLEQNWAASQMEREPDIERVTYDMTLDSYMSMIDDFRRRLVKGRENEKIKNCYVLPFQVEFNRVPLKWLQPKLIGRNGDFTTMHTKHHNVYNMAFSNKEGQVYEMGPALRGTTFVVPTIPGAILLGFNCDYINMINPTPPFLEEEELLEKMRELKLGEDGWFDAIHVLSNHGCNPDHHKSCTLCNAPYAVRRAVRTINFMLNEPARMNNICEAVSGGLSITDVLIYCIWYWKDMSIVMRQWALDNMKTIIDSSLKNKIGASTVDEVALLLHLVLNTLAPGRVLDTTNAGPSSGPSRSSGDDGGGEDKKGKKQAQLPLPRTPGRDDGANKGQPQSLAGPGKTLLQIFTVCPKGIKLHDIKGILVHEDRGTHVIYSRSDAHGFRLSGPDLAISSEAGSFLEIVPGTTKTTTRDDIFMCLDDGFSCYNGTMSKAMNYGGGQVLVVYAVLTGAVELNVEIKLQLPPTGQTY
ncbi:hypothetical protein ZWY2020_035835 [Hordeum vulgare]|nr:hypothetical protein ZWY2020_035835 [Hordeum vulgare]